MDINKTHIIYSPSMGYLDEYIPGGLLRGGPEHKWTPNKKTCFRMSQGSANVRSHVVRKVVPDAIAKPWEE